MDRTRHTIKPDPCPAHLVYSRGRRCDLTAREGVHDHGEGRQRQPRRSIFDDKLPVSAASEIACAALARLQPSPATPQSARASPTAGEAIQASCLAAPARRKPPATRPSRPRIYICGSPRLRPHSRLLPLIVSGTLLATSSTCCNDTGLYPHVLFTLLRMVCGSCGAPAAHANARPRRAPPSSPLRCRDRSVGGSGAGLLRPLIPSHLFLCAQVDQTMSVASSWPSSSRRGPGRARAARRARACSCVGPCDGGVYGCAAA